MRVTLSRFFTGTLLALLLGVVLLQLSFGQDKNSGVARLFRLDGTLGAELPLRVSSGEIPEGSGFALRDARLEGDVMGALTRLRSRLAVANTGAARRIVEVDWRVDVYDESLGTFAMSVGQSDKLNIYPGESGTASANFGAVLPDRMIVLVQVVRVRFEDGSAWTPGVECALARDLRSVSCKRR